MSCSNLCDGQLNNLFCSLGWTSGDLRGVAWNHPWPESTLNAA